MDTSNLAKWIDELAGSVEKNSRAITKLSARQDADTTPFLDVDNAESLTFTEGALELVPSDPCMVRFLLTPDTGLTVAVKIYGSSEDTEGFPLIQSASEVWGTVYLKAGQKLTIENADATVSAVSQIPLTDATPVPVPEASTRKKTTKKK